jgi:hypothetical protein
MTRTSTYQFTVRMTEGKPAAEDQPAIDLLKSHIKWHNRQVKKEVGLKYGRTVGERPLRIKLQGRLGKNNPAAEKYRNGRYDSHQSIYLEDAQTADVYVYTR